MTSPRHTAVPSFCLATVLVAACQSRPSVESESAALRPSASAAGSAAPAPASAAAAYSEAELKAALNPSGEKPYSGPVGAVRGVVRVSGDPAPEMPVHGLPSGRCDDARAFYGKLFREGPGRELGDVLVAVTEYKGFLPAPSQVKTVTKRGCALESRTIALTFGQRLDVLNRSGEALTPELVGGGQAALVVAMPGGEAVKLYPPHVGQYLLKDASHDYIRAHVFVLKYPTAAVTGIDGKFEITGIPVGDVLVSAYLPMTGQTANQRLKIGAGETAPLELTIPFDASKAQPPKK